MLVYHGSDHIIEKPVFNGSKRTNDYGYGFYTTENNNLAKEWACSDNQDGFANCYEADFNGLSVLNLNSPEYSILNWLAILTKYRTYWQNGSIAEEAKQYLQQHFFIDPSSYDVIIGYRADDKRNNKGKTSGSRIMFLSDKYKTKILLHKPHPRKELLEYQIKQLIEQLKQEGLL